jgi:hypothetical protein
MTNLEILVLLNDIKKANFLDAFIIIKNNNKQYKKSRFYKEVKISLAELYKLYYQYTESKFSLSERINEALESIDENILVEKLTNILNSKRVQDFMELVKNNFDLQSLMGESQNLKETLDKFQNLK